MDSLTSASRPWLPKYLTRAKLEQQLAIVHANGQMNLLIVVALCFHPLFLWFVSLGTTSEPLKPLPLPVLVIRSIDAQRLICWESVVSHSSFREDKSHLKGILWQTS